MKRNERKRVSLLVYFVGDFVLNEVSGKNARSLLVARLMTVLSLVGDMPVGYDVDNDDGIIEL